MQPEISNRFDSRSDGDLSRAFTNRIAAVRDAYMLVGVLLMDSDGYDRAAYDCARASGCDAGSAFTSLVRTYLNPRATNAL